MKNPNILEQIRKYAIEIPDVIAVINPYSTQVQLSYRELYVKASLLAKYIDRNVNDKNPIVVYGHKNPYMLVCFLACVMSGHAYCPVDISMPNERISMILEQTESSLVFALEPYETEKTRVIPLEKVVEICKESSRNDIL